LHFLNSSHASWTVGHTMLILVENDFLKGLELPLFWWIWFSLRPADETKRRILIATLPSPFIAFLLGRILAHVLPFRARPFANPDLHWHFVEGFQRSLFLRSWSSFPSDHAACF